MAFVATHQWPDSQQAEKYFNKVLLRQSIASMEGFNKYVAKANLATLLNDEGKWREALDTHLECIDYFANFGAKKQMAQIIRQQALIYQQQASMSRPWNWCAGLKNLTG